MKLVRNGLPDGYVVRLASLGEKHFPTATKVKENADESIDVWFDLIHLRHYNQGEYLGFWPVQRERPGNKRRKGTSPLQEKKSP